MAGKVPDGWYDISVPVKQGMNYYPTDDPPKIYRCLDRDLGGRVNVSMMEIVSIPARTSTPLFTSSREAPRYPICLLTPPSVPAV